MGQSLMIDFSNHVSFSKDFFFETNKKQKYESGLDAL
jgi:hypothetical protein